MLLQHTDISDIPSVRNGSTAALKNALPKRSALAVPCFFLGGFFESSHASWAKDTKQNATVEVDGIFHISYYGLCENLKQDTPNHKKGTKDHVLFQPLA